MYLKRRRGSFLQKEPPIEDPLTGVANLFDLSVVFIVSLILSLFSLYQLLDLFNPQSEFTMIRKTKEAKLEILEKKGKEVKIKRVTDRELEGEGIRLGTAYQLKDGSVVYVPEN